MHHHELVDQVHRLLMDNLPLQSGKTPGGWTTFNCPMCNDRRKRAGVIQTGSKISFHCFNCHYTTGWAPAPRLGGKFKKLVETLGVAITDIHKVVLNLMKYGEELEVEDTADSYVYSAAEFATHNLPEETTLSRRPAEDGHTSKAICYRQRGLLGKCPLMHINNSVYRATFSCSVYV